MTTAPTNLGPEMMALATRLYPICRSITGDGLRQTLRIIGEHIPLTYTEVPTGTLAFDWTIPNEWNLRRATLRGPDGMVIADTDVHTLHVVNYSEPMRGTFTLEELKTHLFSLPDKPGVIPYRTSYYSRTWGFCLRDDVLRTLPEGKYEVDIDTTLQPGSLTYAECGVKGESTDEVLFGCHCCHPSLANDNLSGIVVATGLATWLRSRETKPRFTYRFLFNPGTIGSIAWLSRNVETTKRIRHGLVLSCLGDAGGMTYKKSRRDDAEIDRIVRQVLGATGNAHTVVDFSPYGYDERQYCSPGFNLPVGVLMRTPNGKYPEYHTSADNLNLLKESALLDSLTTLKRVVEVIEGNRTYVNTSPFCEPQLGKRGLYSNMGGSNKPPGFEMALLWVLNQSDGVNDLLAISAKSGLPFETVRIAADRLLAADLLRLS
ncbi:MAG: DUF4910 domain-containing protein [Tepidisphaeraceae bacterium]